VQVDGQSELLPGSTEEIEIRAACIHAVELIRKTIQDVHVGIVPTSVQLDWWLWQAGERSRTNDPPHHRTHTIYY
jgi:hypothetical protein